MPYRPLSNHRQDVHGIIYPLTAAIYRIFGSRAQDGARPIGAFYPVNVGVISWQHVGGIWYRPRNEESILGRAIDESVVVAFSQSIHTGEPVTLPTGITVNWEILPADEARQLPPPLHEHAC